MPKKKSNRCSLLRLVLWPRGGKGNTNRTIVTLIAMPMSAAAVSTVLNVILSLDDILALFDGVTRASVVLSLVDVGLALVNVVLLWCLVVLDRQGHAEKGPPAHARSCRAARCIVF